VPLAPAAQVLSHGQEADLPSQVIELDFRAENGRFDTSSDTPNLCPIEACVVAPSD